MLFRSGGMSWGTPTPSGQSRRHPTHWGQGMDTTRQETHSMEVTATSQQKERSNLSFLKVHVHVCLTIFSDLAHFSKWPNSIQTSHSLQIYISQSVILTVAISQMLPITACRHSLMWGNGYLQAWYTRHSRSILYFSSDRAPLPWSAGQGLSPEDCQPNTHQRTHTTLQAETRGSFGMS